MNNQQKYVALYERLSHDDEQLGESNSISHQKEMLEELKPQTGDFYIYSLGRVTSNQENFRTSPDGH